MWLSPWNTPLWAPTARYPSSRVWMLCEGSCVLWCATAGGQDRARALPGAERLPRFGGELWAPYLRDTLLRVFASAGASGQLGRFTRPFLDYTAAFVRPHRLFMYLCQLGTSHATMQAIL